MRIGFGIFAPASERIDRFEVSRDTFWPWSQWFIWQQYFHIKMMLDCLSVFQAKTFGIIFYPHLYICSHWIHFCVCIAGCRHRHVADLGWQAVDSLCILIYSIPLLPLFETCWITNGITSHWALLITPVNHRSAFPLERVERVQMVRASTARFNASAAEMMCSRPWLLGFAAGLSGPGKQELQMLSTSAS